MTASDRAVPTAISVVGLGKLGLPLAGCLAASGFRTIGVDVIDANVREINAGRSPIVEPGLADLVAAHAGSGLCATTNMHEAVGETDLTFVIVPTPSDASGRFSNAFVRDALARIGDAVKASGKPDHLAVVSSTVMPGSIDGELGPLLAERSGRALGAGIDICYDPDFISLGEVIRGLRQPELVLIGEHRPESGSTVEAVHRRMVTNSPYVARMSVVSAEITKLALNAYVTMKISFANNLADICSAIPGANVDDITNALGADTRISPRYLSAGLSFGGTCFPRDTVAFRALAGKSGVAAPLMDATEAVNTDHARRLSDLVLHHQERTGGAVAVLGLAFRHDTPVIAASPSLALVRDLLDAGVHVIGCDMLAEAAVRQELGDAIEYAATPEETLTRAAVVVVTHRSAAFRSAVERFKPSKPLVVIDCWRTIDPRAVAPSVSLVPFGRAIGKGRAAL
jgi:UDPglucose 6-dehydrogenase